MSARLMRILFFALMMVVIRMQPAITHAQDGGDAERPLILAHFMPWYQTPDVRGYWGWHWTMDHFNPYRTDENGRPEIASHYMPLTGPYDSSDEAVLEYQVLLMKLSGIDGVIVDWYGTENFRDYAELNGSTVKLFETVKRAGLKFVLCYEDQTVKHMLTEHYIDASEAHARAQEDMLFAQEHWLNDDAYVRHQGQPLLFVFGPQQFRTPNDWETIFSALDTSPALVTLDGHMGFGALASYPWPPMEYAGGAELFHAVLENYLDRFYRSAQRGEFIVGSAFPGFHDIYEEADVRSSYGYLDRQDDTTLRLTLDFALNNDADIIQLVTWNDYGEGTIIEPTEEFGYQYLQIVQHTRRGLERSAFPFTADDLHLPLQLFELRRAHAGDADINAQLDLVFEAIVAGDLDTAADALSGF